MDSNIKTWLFTWNPKNYSDGGDGKEDYQLDLDIGQPVRWSCSSQSPKAGDVAYLIRVGVSPKGLIAKGHVASDPYMDEDWRDSTKKKSYVDIEFEEHRPTCAKGLVPLLLLEQAFASQRWTPQASGISISSDIASELGQLWESGASSHGLEQYFNWLGKNEYNQRWKDSYLSITQWTRDVRDGKRNIDDDLIYKLWKEPANGVASLKQGGISNVEYENNKPFLNELTKLILEAPLDQGTFDEVFRLWEGKKESGEFRQINKALIHRVFGAVAPEGFATIARYKMCRKLATYLNQAFEVDVDIGDDWFQINKSLSRILNSFDLPEDKRIDCNRHLWRIYDNQFNKENDNEGQDSEVGRPSMDNAEIDNASLNQILYGPPGTGKTYHTINKAVSIIDPSFYEEHKASREKLKSRFDQLKQDGRIEFVTFHQSFSYEDFVEGLQATSDGERISYSVEPGIFRRICDRASSTKKTLAVDEAVEKFSDEAAQTPILLETPSGKKITVTYRDGKTFRISPESSGVDKDFPANRDHVKELLLGASHKNFYNPSYVRGIADYIRTKYNLSEDNGAEAESENKPYVLIIDEINRGNIAKIFGELITLIEESKRKGAEEELSASLPYSKKDDFFVPKNLFIIGTMNTADRSLAQLDIALRRRFVFHEMMPNPELLKDVPLIEGINIFNMLKTINERIELLYDREHTIGHSHFMPLIDEDNATLESLRSIFESQIIPLLEEYFFEDWDLIGKVLGDHNKPDEYRFIKPKFKNNDIEQLMGAEWAADHGKQVFIRDETALANPNSYIGIYEKLSTEAAE